MSDVLVGTLLTTLAGLGWWFLYWPDLRRAPADTSGQPDRLVNVTD